jgi:hypothetical protein
LLRFDFLLFPALRSAIATACFCGFPAFFSFLMFELIVLREDPFFKGIVSLLASDEINYARLLKFPL